MHSCRAKGADAKLLLSNRVTIRQVDLVTQEYRPLISQLDSAVAMDFFHRNNTLIWSDVAQEKIMICHLGANVTQLHNVTECKDGHNSTLVSDEISTPDGLAVDWVHELLYWTDTGLDRISVMHLQTRYRRTLFDSGLDEPRAIAVDPRAGVIFWTDWGNDARIERAGMDGSYRKTIISGDSIKWPNGLALDLLEQRIYWADAKMKMISSADYWGNDRRMVLQSWSALKHPFSLSLFEELLYWTDWDVEGVLAVNKFTGGDPKTVVHGISGPMTVRVYHELTQPMLPNKCLGHTCSDLCLPRPHITENPPTPIDKSVSATPEQLKDAIRSLIAPPYACMCRDGHKAKDSNGDQCIPNGNMTVAMVAEIDGKMVGANSTNSTSSTTNRPTTTRTTTHLIPPMRVSTTLINPSDFTINAARSTNRAIIDKPSDKGTDNANGERNAASETIAPNGSEKQKGKMAFTTFSILVIISMVALLVGYMWWRKRAIPLRTLNFDNPVYRRTVEETDSDPETYSDNPASISNGQPGNRLKLSLDAENYNPSRPAVNDGFVSESARQPLTQAMV